jgi:C-terminal processing protease CtpA/Prc
MTGLAVLTLLAAPASPVPAVPPAPANPAAADKVDRNQALQFAQLVHRLAEQVARDYVVEKKDHVRELIDCAVRGLYDEVGHAVPDNVKAAVARANGVAELVEVLTDARIQLGHHPNLSGAKSLFAAMNGFKHATDPSNGLYSQRVTTYASVDHDFGIGFELEGAVGTRWTLYQVEHGVASRRYPALGWIGPVPQPDAVPSPAGFPWKVRRVVPGSPTQRAGVKPGDTITHLNGTEITAENANRLFAQFNTPGQVIDPTTGRPLPPDRVLTFRRGEGRPFTATLKAEAYAPESVFGVARTPDDRWDCMLDRKNKIGYIRLGPIELGLDTKVAEMVGELEKRGCRALILDLRWCPGGYVNPGTNIAGLFLKGDTVIAKTEARNPARLSTPAEIRTPPNGGQFASLMMVVLVGQETTGGGELIASALRDNGRCVVIGQRTVGRASIQITNPAGFADVQFRVTAGVSFRPNGKPRQRLPDSGPLDDWGVRPDEGLEVPVTADKSAELRRQAELHALRPADSREALPFDDPDADPYRLMALTYLRKQLGPPPEPKKK